MSFSEMMSSISQFLSGTTDFFCHHPVYALTTIGVAVIAAAYLKFCSN